MQPLEIFQSMPDGRYRVDLGNNEAMLTIGDLVPVRGKDGEVFYAKIETVSFTGKVVVRRVD